jgi:hypothetical protein
MINRRSVIASAVGTSFSLAPLCSIAQPRMIVFLDLDEQMALADVAERFKNLLIAFFNAVNTAVVTGMHLSATFKASLAKYHNGIIENEDFDWNAVNRDAIARAGIPSLITFLQTIVGSTGNVRQNSLAFVTAFVQSFSNGFMVTYIEMMLHLYLRKHFGMPKQLAKWTAFALAQAYVTCYNLFLVNLLHGHLLKVFALNEPRPELRRKLLAKVHPTDNGTNIARLSTEHTFITNKKIHLAYYVNNEKKTTRNKSVFSKI